MGSPGFSGAPVSKLVSILTAVATLAVLSNRNQETISLVAYRVLGEEIQWWRLVISLFPLGSVWELMLTLHLVRVFRVLERHLGSAKFGSFVVLAAAMSKSMELAFCVQFPHLRPPSGPVSIISALATMYYGYIPPRTPVFSVRDIQVTEKTFTYIAVLLLAFHRSWSSVMSVGCGIVMSLLYCSNVSRLQRFRVPGQRLFAVVGQFFQSGNQVAARRSQGTRIQPRERRVRGGTDAQDQLIGQVVGAGTANGLRQRLELPPPSEEDVTLLMGLGFDRSTVVRVLRSSGNNTEAAANQLLGH